MKCILCGSENNNQVLTNITNPRNVGEKTYTYVQCNQCNLYLLSPLPSQQDLLKIYDSNYNLYQTENKNLVSNILEKLSTPRLDTVKKYIHNNQSILDVGCGNGEFLKQMQDLSIKVHGTEWSQHAATQAKEKVGQENITIGDIINIPIDKKFNSASLWHVLEHNLEPDKLISNITEKLQENAYLFIEVPNADSVTLHSSKNRYAWYSIPEHVTYWNSQSLNFLAKKHSFEVVEEIFPFSMPFLFYKSTNNILFLPISPLVSLYGIFTRQTDIIRQVWKKMS